MSFFVCHVDTRKNQEEKLLAYAVAPTPAGPIMSTVIKLKNPTDPIPTNDLSRRRVYPRKIDGNMLHTPVLVLEWCLKVAEINL